MPVKPTTRQKKAFKNLVENSSTEKQAILDAGYSEATAIKPQQVKNSRGFQQLVAKHLPDDDLLRVHKEGLGAIDKDGNVDYNARHKYVRTGYEIKRLINNDSPLEKPEINILVYNGNNDSPQFRPKDKTVPAGNPKKSTEVQVTSYT